MVKRKQGRPAWPDVLTPAEWRIVHASRHGMSNRAIATHLGVSVDAVRYHLKNISAKLGAEGKQALRHRAVFPADSALQKVQPTGESRMDGIGQIARTVGSLENSVKWFSEVLGMTHLYTFGNMAFFDCGGTRLMLAEKEEVNAEESLIYFRVSDITGAWESLQAKGVEFLQAPHRIHVHEDGTEEWMTFLKDPDGRPLGLMSQVRVQAD